MDETEKLKRENEELKEKIEKLKSLRINQKEGMIKKSTFMKIFAEYVKIIYDQI